MEDGASDQDRDTQDISECRTRLAFFVSEVRSLLDIQVEMLLFALGREAVSPLPGAQRRSWRWAL